MVARKVLSFGESFNYKGIIESKKLYNLINKWLEQRGYDLLETMNSEHVYPDGKQILIDMEPYNEISDYAKVILHIIIDMRKLKEKTIKHKDKKEKVMTGEATFTFHTYLETDRDGLFQSDPLMFFFKTIMERFLYKSYDQQYSEEVIRDKNELMREIKSFLNMNQF